MDGISSTRETPGGRRSSLLVSEDHQAVVRRTPTGLSVSSLPPQASGPSSEHEKRRPDVEQPPGPPLLTREASIPSDTEVPQQETKGSKPQAQASTPPEAKPELLTTALQALCMQPLSIHEKACRALELATQHPASVQPEALRLLHSTLLTSMSQDSTWRQLTPGQVDPSVSTGGAPGPVAIFRFYEALAAHLPKIAKDPVTNQRLRLAIQEEYDQLPSYRLKVEAAMLANMKHLASRIEAAYENPFVEFAKISERAAQEKEAAQALKDRIQRI